MLTFVQFRVNFRKLKIDLGHLKLMQNFGANITCFEWFTSPKFNFQPLDAPLYYLLPYDLRVF